MISISITEYDNCNSDLIMIHCDIMNINAQGKAAPHQPRHYIGHGATKRETGIPTDTLSEKNSLLMVRRKWKD